MSSRDLLRALKETVKYWILYSAGAGAKPVKLRLAVTNQCSARCIMCNVWRDPSGQAEREKELSVPEYEMLFSRNRNLFSRLKHVSITGGEPTLRSDLTAIVEVVSRHHPRASVSLNTNALNSDRLLQFIKEASGIANRLTVMISLDGLGEAHDTIRGVPGAFHKAYRSIEEVLKLRNGNKGVKLAINHILSRHNYREFEKINRLCVDNHISITPIVPQKGEAFRNEGLDVALDAEATAYLTDVFEKLLSTKKGFSLQNIEVLELLKGKPRDYRCWAGTMLLLIQEQGDVYPNGGCPADWRLGNIREHDYRLHDVLQTEQAKSVCKKVARCRNCRLACEMLTTLRGPEALAGYRKMKEYEPRSYRSAV